MLGIRTSEMTQHDRLAASELRNASADAKLLAEYPSDRTRLAVAIRIDSSSSTIDITGFFVT